MSVCHTATSIRSAIRFNATDLGYDTIATGLSSPRAITLDLAGHLLVVERGKGISAFVSGTSSCNGWLQTSVIDDTALNHGIAISGDGQTLYASSEDALYSWAYDAATSTATARQTLVTGMGGTSHNTRTIALEPVGCPSYVVLGRGSDGNVDVGGAALNHSQVRSFALSATSTTPLDWSEGRLLGTGLRNCVGLTISPDAQTAWCVENSADQLATPDGVDVSNANPSEDINSIPLSSDSPPDYGYPTCFTVFDGASFPGGKQTGSQFSVQANITDEQCEARSRAPRLGLPAHYAPLDIKYLLSSDTSFGSSWANSAIVASHGSWNANPPVGYALLRVPVDTKSGEPVAPSTSMTGFETIFAPPDLTRCPSACFRPVGVAVESSRGAQNGIFVSSDSTGEIIRVRRGASQRSTAARHSAMLGLLLLGLLAQAAGL